MWSELDSHAQLVAFGQRVPVEAGGPVRAVHRDVVAVGLGARRAFVLVVGVVALVDLDQRLHFGIVVAVIAALVGGQRMQHADAPVLLQVRVQNRAAVDRALRFPPARWAARGRRARRIPRCDGRWDKARCARSRTAACSRRGCGTGRWPSRCATRCTRRGPRCGRMTIPVSMRGGVHHVAEVIFDASRRPAPSRRDFGVPVEVAAQNAQLAAAGLDAIAAGALDIGGFIRMDELGGGRRLGKGFELAAAGRRTPHPCGAKSISLWRRLGAPAAAGNCRLSLVHTAHTAGGGRHELKRAVGPRAGIRQRAPRYANGRLRTPSGTAPSGRCWPRNRTGSWP